MSRLFAIGDTVNTDDWYTPAWVFNGLGLTFDLDVAAPIGGVSWVPALRSMSESDDGLTSPWHGTVWCNPPYSAPTAWCRKWATHPAGCLLIRADLSTGGPYVAVSAAHAIYVPQRRFQYVNGHGGKCNAVTFSTVLLGRGAHVIDAMHRLASRAGGCTRTLANSSNDPQILSSPDGTDAATTAA